MSLRQIWLIPYLLNNLVLHGHLWGEHRFRLSKDVLDDFFVVGHNLLVDEVWCLLIDIASHYCIFQVLQSVVYMDSLLNRRSHSLVKAVLLALFIRLVFFVKIESVAALKLKGSILALSLGVFILGKFNRVLREFNYFFKLNYLWQEFSVIESTLVFVLSAIRLRFLRLLGSN